MKRTLFVLALAVVALALFVPAAFAANPVSDSVEIKGSVNKAVVLTLSTDTLDFGALDPGQTGSESVDVTVQSNHPYKVERSALPAGATDIGLSISTNSDFDGSVFFPKAPAGTTKTDTYDIDVPWTAPTGSFLFPITYTVTANPV